MREVGDLDRSSTSTGNTWTANVTIAVHDGTHAPSPGASVTGNWSSGGTVSCTTGASGTCTISRSGIRKNVGSVTLTVTGVTKTSHTYLSTANHDSDGDSNGTAITVLKP